MTGRLTLTPKANCPACRGILNAASILGTEAQPGPGDLTVCIHCQAVLQWDRKMRLGLAPQDVVDEYMAEVARTMSHLTDKTYSLVPGPEGVAILCHRCGRSSYSQGDILNRYCGNCHVFHE